MLFPRFELPDPDEGIRSPKESRSGFFKTFKRAQRLAFLCGFRVFRSLKPSDKTKKCRETRIMVSASETEKASKIRKQIFRASRSGENYGFSESPSKGWQVKERRNLTKLRFQRVTWWRMASQRKEKFDKIRVSANDLAKDGKSKRGEIWQN